MYRELLNWDRGQADSERLALQLLHREEYEALDPIHPLGGQDGTKDIICFKNGIRWIGAAYFPNGQQCFSKIFKKFQDDTQGVEKNAAQGIAFITNQELTEGEREQLREYAHNHAISYVDIFHLERIGALLNTPQCYGIRLEFLDVGMTKEEQVAFIDSVNQQYAELHAVVTSLRNTSRTSSAIPRSLLLQWANKKSSMVPPDSFETAIREIEHAIEELTKILAVLRTLPKP